MILLLDRAPDLKKAAGNAEGALKFNLELAIVGIERNKTDPKIRELYSC